MDSRLPSSYRFPVADEFVSEKGDVMEELDISSVLERLNGHNLNRIERVLVAHTGTVQLMLSLWFGEPVDVIVKSQVEQGTTLIREVALTLRKTRLKVCHAKSQIPLDLNSQVVVEEVKRRQIGLGQIATSLNILSQRVLISLEVTPTTLSRTYVMVGPGLRQVIEERFPRKLYQHLESESDQMGCTPVGASGR